MLSLRLFAGPIFALAVLSSGWTTAVAAESTNGENPVGRQIENFTLNDYRGRERSLNDWKDAECLVVVFLGTECPLVKLYAPRLAQLAEAWKDRDVAFVGINSNRQDSLAEVAAYAQRYGIPFPVLKDPANRVADLFGAVRTPEVFVLDKDRVVRYWGRIDDQFGIGIQKPSVDREDLKVSLTELLEGKEISKPITEAPGCLIGRVLRPDPSGEVTYTEHVAHVLKKRCTECHHEGQIAPFSLTSYDDAVGWAEMIQEVVHDRRMPPWFASPEHDGFRNNPTMTEEEIALIDEWIECGCNEGDPAALPSPLEVAEGWGIPEPDDVIYMSDEPFSVPADGAVAYQYYTVDPGNSEDRWIKFAEVKAGNPAVVHHVIVFIQSPGGGRFGNPQMAYAPGMTPRRFRDDMAIKLPAGAKLVFQVHYTPNGTPQTDRSYVGFVYADAEEVKYEVVGGSCGTLALKIPPHDPAYQIQAQQRFRRDTLLLGMNPHMHVRGKSFRYELLHPDGSTELLLDVPRYDFNWQLWYNLKEPKVMPKGSRLICTAQFDNSEDNLANPDPSQEVTWGEQTWDEMMFGFYSYIVPVEATN